jgi:hypothetical protein
MKTEIYVVLAIAIIGWILWCICQEPGMTLKKAVAKLGEVMLYAGMFAFCFAIANHVLHLP